VSRRVIAWGVHRPLDWWQAVDVDVLPPTTGSLLVALPALVDPNFAQTVVLLLDHDEDGTLGVVLNRPTDVVAAEVLPGAAALIGPSTPIFAGGPVAPQNAVAVGALAPQEPDPLWFRRVFGDIGLVDVDALEDGTAHITEVRVYAGYAGWSPGQLEAELAEGAWYVLPLLRTDVFSAEPEDLWRAVFRRQRAPLSFLATWTDEPEAN
jgi:putative transcriptional regulator